MDKLEIARNGINQIDCEMALLFEKRMKLCEEIAEFKKEYNLPVCDKNREKLLISKNLSNISEHSLRPYYVEFINAVIGISSSYQSELINSSGNECRSSDKSAESFEAQCVVSEKESSFYDIVLEHGSLKHIGDFLNLNRKVLIVTDDGVPKEYSEFVAANCAHPVIVCIPHGESGKNIAELGNLISVMLNGNFTRDDCIVAVGGGVVSDIGGFAASCYMRGIDYYNVPTTLLSQVDSSIGGKTAVNFNGVKNAVGSFYQPKKVVIDTCTIKTLSERQINAGIAESVKMAVTSDAELFALLEESEYGNLNYDEIIRRSLMIKKKVVEKDTTEKGLRRVLNFGHTVGHAIESCSNGKLLHGECVALGMIPMTSCNVRERLVKVLKKYKLPTEIQYSPEQLEPYMMHDKKNTAHGITVVISENIGSFRFCQMSVEEIVKRLEGVR